MGVVLDTPVKDLERVIYFDSYMVINQGKSPYPRKTLLSNNILSEHKEYYQFEEDFIFDSCSTAGGVVLGRATNGWTTWKNKEGKTLDEIKRK